MLAKSESESRGDPPECKGAIFQVRRKEIIHVDDEVVRTRTSWRSPLRNQSARANQVDRYVCRMAILVAYCGCAPAAGAIGPRANKLGTSMERRIQWACRSIYAHQ